MRQVTACSDMDCGSGTCVVDSLGSPKCDCIGGVRVSGTVGSAGAACGSAMSASPTQSPTPPLSSMLPSPSPSPPPLRQITLSCPGQDSGLGVCSGRGMCVWSKSGCDSAGDYECVAVCRCGSHDDNEGCVPPWHRLIGAKLLQACEHAYAVPYSTVMLLLVLLILRCDEGFGGRDCRLSATTASARASLQDLMLDQLSSAVSVTLFHTALLYSLLVLASLQHCACGVRPCGSLASRALSDPKSMVATWMLCVHRTCAT